MQSIDKNILGHAEEFLLHDLSVFLCMLKAAMI